MKQKKKKIPEKLQMKNITNMNYVQKKHQYAIYYI